MSDFFCHSWSEITFLHLFLSIFLNKVVLPHKYEFLIYFSCFHRRLVTMYGLCHLGISVCFHRPIRAFTYVWVIQKVKHIRSDKDNKSNHSRQYVTELKSYVL